MIPKAKIEKILHGNLAIEHLELTDESAKHAGHTEAVRSGGGHFTLLVISRDFEGKKPIDRHKFIYRVLHQEMRHSIHALSIKAYTPQEYQSQE